MPLIEFKCKNCGHTQERIMHFTVDRMRCEECAKFTHKVMSAPAAHFKGPGFHATDYKKPDGGGLY